MNQRNSNQTGVRFNLFFKVAPGITNSFFYPVVFRTAVVFPGTRVWSLGFLTVVFSWVRYSWYRIQ